MKKGLFKTLILAFVVGNCFAATPIAERAKLIDDNLKGDKMKAIETLNKQLQGGEIKTNDQNYIVALEKSKDSAGSDEYTRVIHFKKEKVGQKVEPVLLNIIKDAESKLGNGNGPASFKFSADGKELFAAVSRYGELIVFNISSESKEVDALCGVKEEKKDESTKSSVDAASDSGKVTPKKEEAVTTESISEKATGENTAEKTENKSVPEKASAEKATD